MPNWKRAVILGSFIGAAFLMLKSRRLPGMVVAGVGAAVLASEYPDRIEELWEHAPEYLERGSQVLAAISRIKDRLETDGPRVVSGMWKRASEY